MRNLMLLLCILSGLPLFLCSSDKNQILVDGQFPSYLGEMVTDTLYPDSLYLYRDKNITELLPKVYLANNQYFQTYILLQFNSTYKIDSAGMENIRVSLYNLYEEDSVFRPFQLSVYKSNQSFDLADVNDSNFWNYFPSTPIQQLDLTTEMPDTLYFSSIPHDDQFLSTIGTDTFQFSLLVTINSELADQSYEFGGTLYGTYMGISYSYYDPRFTFTQTGDTTQINKYFTDSKTLIQSKKKYDFYIPSVMNDLIYLHFDLSRYNPHTVIHRAQLVMFYDPAQSYQPGFSVGFYNITRGDWQTTDTSYYSLLFTNSTYDDSLNQQLSFKTNDLSQAWVSITDSVVNYGAMIRYSSNETHLGFLPLLNKGLSDSSYMPRLIVTRSLPTAGDQ